MTDTCTWCVKLGFVTAFRTMFFLHVSFKSVWWCKYCWALGAFQGGVRFFSSTHSWIPFCQVWIGCFCWFWSLLGWLGPMWTLSARVLRVLIWMYFWDWSLVGTVARRNLCIWTLFTLGVIRVSDFTWYRHNVFHDNLLFYNPGSYHPPQIFRVPCGLLKEIFFHFTIWGSSQKQMKMNVLFLCISH